MQQPDAGPVFSALSDATRRTVVEALASRETATATELASELASIAAPLDPDRPSGGRLVRAAHEDADSALLDETVTKLIRLDTRIALLHEALRTATQRTTALVIE